MDQSILLSSSRSSHRRPTESNPRPLDRKSGTLSSALPWTLPHARLKLSEHVILHSFSELGLCSFLSCFDHKLRVISPVLPQFVRRLLSLCFFANIFYLSS